MHMVITPSHRFSLSLQNSWLFSCDSELKEKRYLEKENPARQLQIRIWGLAWINQVISPALLISALKGFISIWIYNMVHLVICLRWR